ncbi:39875_t:CDS:2, partial [Gigaspora margarita]
LTNGNNDINNIIMDAQKNSNLHNKIIEMIPFESIVNIQESGQPIASREPFCKVALKSLIGTQNILLNFMEENHNFPENVGGKLKDIEPKISDLGLPGK